jgi:hypothetical protein
LGIVSVRENRQRGGAAHEVKLAWVGIAAGAAAIFLGLLVLVGLVIYLFLW